MLCFKLGGPKVNFSLFRGTKTVFNINPINNIGQSEIPFLNCILIWHLNGEKIYRCCLFFFSPHFTNIQFMMKLQLETQELWKSE